MQQIIFTDVLWQLIFANTMDPDQTAPNGAVWSGLILFAFMIESSQERKKNMQQRL